MARAPAARGATFEPHGPSLSIGTVGLFVNRITAAATRRAGEHRPAGAAGGHAGGEASARRQRTVWALGKHRAGPRRAARCYAMSKT